jgi:hypothetical protein
MSRASDSFDTVQGTLTLRRDPDVARAAWQRRKSFASGGTDRLGTASVGSRGLPDHPSALQAPDVDMGSDTPALQWEGDKRRAATGSSRALRPASRTALLDVCCTRRGGGRRPADDPCDGTSRSSRSGPVHDQHAQSVQLDRRCTAITFESRSPTTLFPSPTLASTRIRLFGTSASRISPPTIRFFHNVRPYIQLRDDRAGGHGLRDPRGRPDVQPVST